MSEQIFSHSSPLKIRLDFSEIKMDFYSTKVLLELLVGRELVFPHSSAWSVEFEMLYVRELVNLLEAMESSSSNLGRFRCPGFAWGTDKSLITISVEEL